MNLKRSQVLKGPDIASGVRHVVERRVKLSDTMDECNCLLADAEKRAQQIVEEANQRAKQIEKEARSKAEQATRQNQQACEQMRQQLEAETREQVAEETRAAIRAEVADFVERMKQMATEAQECLQQAIHDFEPELVQLALSIAQEIIQVRLEQDDEMVQRVVQNALQRAGDREEIVIRIHPEDYNAIESHVPNLSDAFPDIARVSVEPDARVDRGGCMIETRMGTVDARVAQQLARLRAALEA